MEIPIEEVCRWMTTHDQGLQFIKFITEERDTQIQAMELADDCALRKIAGGINVLQGWLEQFEEHAPKVDG